MTMDTEKTLKEIIFEMQKSLECSICLELLNNPVSTNCDHQFCRFCILKFLLNKRSVLCPLCKKSITKRSLQDRNDLVPIIALVKDLISAFEADIGEKCTPSKVSKKILNDSVDNVLEEKNESTSGEKSKENNVISEVSNSKQYNRRSSLTTCRVSNTLCSNIDTLKEAGGILLEKTDLCLKYKKENEQKNDLLKYLENGSCGDKVLNQNKKSICDENYVAVSNTNSSENLVETTQEKCIANITNEVDKTKKEKNGATKKVIKDEDMSIQAHNVNTAPVRRSSRHVPKIEVGMITDQTHLQITKEAGEPISDTQSSCTSVSSTQHLLKPKPVVSRTYSKGMHHMFRAERCVRNWVETLPKNVAECTSVNIKGLTTKEKINIKKRNNQSLLTNTTSSTLTPLTNVDEKTSNEPSKADAAFDAKIPLTTRPKRSIFKHHLKDVFGEKSELNDPFKFTSSQTPVDVKNVERKRKKVERFCTNKKTKLDFSPVSETKSLCIETDGQFANEVGDQNESILIQDVAVDVKQIENMKDKSEAVSSNIKDTSPALVEDTIDKNEPIDPLVIITNCNDKLKQSTMTLDIESLDSNDNNALTQKSAYEMMQLIDKISQAESHELLFSTQDAHQHMEVDLSKNLVHSHPTSDPVSMTQPSTDVIETSISVSMDLNVESLTHTKINSDNLQKDQSVMSPKLLNTLSNSTFHDQALPTTLHLGASNLLKNSSTLLGEKLAENSKSPQDFNLLENSKSSPIIKLPESSESFHASHFLQVDNWTENDRTPKASLLLEKYNDVSKNSGQLPTNVLSENPNPSFLIKQQNKLTHGNMKSPACLKIGKLPLKSNFCMPDLKAMVEVSPCLITIASLNSATSSSVSIMEDKLTKDIGQQRKEIMVIGKKDKQISPEPIFSSTEINKTDSARSVSLNEKVKLVIPENLETFQELSENILVPDTVLDASQVEVVSPVDAIVQETLDVEAVSTYSMKKVGRKEHCVSNILHDLTERHDSNNDTNVDKTVASTEGVNVKNSSNQLIIAETQCNSSQTTLELQSVSTNKTQCAGSIIKTLSLEYNQFLENANDIPTLNNVHSETTSIDSLSILNGNQEQITTFSDASAENKSDSTNNYLHILDKNECDISLLSQPFTQATDGSSKRLGPIVNNNVTNQSQQKLDAHIQQSSGPSKGNLPLLSVTSDCASNSVPSRFDLTDSEDEDNVLIVRRSKRKCLSLSDLPIKPLVLKKKKDDVITNDEMISETEAIDTLINSKETDGDDYDSNIQNSTSYQSPQRNTFAYCQIPKDSFLELETVKLKSVNIFETSEFHSLNCSQVEDSPIKILERNNDTQDVKAIKTKRGLASKKILTELNNQSKSLLFCHSTAAHLEASMNKKKIDCEMDFVVAESDSEPEENVQLTPYKKPEIKISETREILNNRDEDLFKKQLEKELFEEKKEDLLKKDGIVTMASEECLHDNNEISFDLMSCSDEEDISAQKLNEELVEEIELHKCPPQSPDNIVSPNISQSKRNSVSKADDNKCLSSSKHLTSSPMHKCSVKQDNIEQFPICENKRDDESIDDDDEDCSKIKKKKKHQIISSESDESDIDDHTNGTCSSFLSSQSETLTTQQQFALEKDLEKLHQEIAHYEEELRRQSAICLSEERQITTDSTGDKSKSMATLVVVDDSPETVVDKNKEDSTDLFLSPELLPTQYKSGVSASHLSKADHFLKQFQSPGGSVRSKKCLDFTTTSVIKDSDSINKTQSLKKSQKSDAGVQKLDSRKTKKNGNNNLALSPVLSTQKKNMPGQSQCLDYKKRNDCLKKKCFLIASGLTKEDHFLLLKFCDKFGATLYPKFAKDVTHVIMKPAVSSDLVCDRTLKFFQGVAHKCWVLSFMWIAQSLQAELLLPEVRYEIEGDTTCGEKLMGAKHSRLSKHLLFENFCFACIGNSEEMSKENLCDILQVCGGIMVDDPIELTLTKSKYKLIIRCSDADNVPTPVELDMFNGLYKHMKLITVMREWVLDCLSSYKLISLAEYVLSSVKIEVPF